MPGKRNDVEECAAEREIAFTRVTSAWALVLVILFWATAPWPEDRSIRFSIQGSLGGDVVCAGSAGECAEGTEMIRSSQAMPQEFNAPRALVWKTWTDLKQVSLWWWPKKLSGSERGVPAAQIEMMATFGEEGKTRLAMRIVFASGLPVRDDEGTEDAWRTAA